MGISEPSGGYLFLILFIVFRCTGPSTDFSLGITIFIFASMLFLRLSDVAAIAVEFLYFFQVPLPLLSNTVLHPVVRSLPHNYGFPSVDVPYRGGNAVYGFDGLRCDHGGVAVGKGSALF